MQAGLPGSEVQGLLGQDDGSWSSTFNGSLTGRRRGQRRRRRRRREEGAAEGPEGKTWDSGEGSAGTLAGGLTEVGPFLHHFLCEAPPRDEIKTDNTHRVNP